MVSKIGFLNFFNDIPAHTKVSNNVEDRHMSTQL